MKVDYAARLSRARGAAEAAGLDALLISPGPDLRYLTGYDSRLPDRLTCLIVPTGGEPLIVVPELEAPGVAASPLGDAGMPVLTWTDMESPYARVAAQLPRSGTVAVSDAMWASQALALRAEMPGVEQRPSGPVLRQLRMQKDDTELAALREAAAAVDAVLARLPEFLQTGRSEREVGADVRLAMLAAGHESAGSIIVASGPNGASPHHELSDRVIRRGDAVVVDLGGAMPSGYWSDCTRMYVMGEPAEEFVALYGLLREAQEAGCRAVRDGVPMSAVDAATREIIAAAGHGPCFMHRTGHGIGLQLHEEPSIKAGNEEPVVAGMVFSVEPGMYFPGRFGMRLEDIVAATADGCERLNKGTHAFVIVE
jgi:Xaa-Pro aminopeptidase